MTEGNDAFWELMSREHIDVDTLSPEELNETFNFLNQQMLRVYHFVLSYNDYINTKHPYTEAKALTTLEAHLLTDICDYPDSTVTSLANAWNRSVSATSQTIRKLIQKDLVTRENSKSDAKVFHLRPTEKGLAASDAHKRYDALDTVKTIKCLRHTLTKTEIENMFKALEIYTGLLLRKK